MAVDTLEGPSRTTGTAKSHHHEHGEADHEHSVPQASHSHHHHSPNDATHHGHNHEHCHDDHHSCSHSHTGWRQYMPHAHSLETRLRSDTRSLQIAFTILCLTFVLQLMFGIVARSSALMVEALHTALDGLTVIISLVSALISRRKATKRMSYGYARAEVLSALLSVLALALLCAKLFATGVRRLWRIYNGEQIQVDGMLVALAEAITLVSNVGMALVLARGTSSKSLNLRALRAHVIADCIENVVVLVGGVIMWKIPNFAVLDPALTVVIVGVIVVMNIGICKETVATLMQSAPRGVVEGIADDLIAINGVMSVRRLHVWTLTTGCLIGTVVVIVDDDASHKDVKKQVEEVFAQFGVENVTVQINDADERDDGESIASDRSDTNVGANGYEFVREDDDIV